MKNETWDFYQDHEARWQWRAIQSTRRAASKTGFSSRSECIVDAMRNGYLAMPPIPRSTYREVFGAAEGPPLKSPPEA